MDTLYDLDDICVVNIKEISRNDLGVGVDIIADKRLASPFRTAQPTRSSRDENLNSVPGAHGEGTVSICENEETARSAFYFSVGAACALNMQPIDMSAGVQATLMGSVQQSSTSFSMVVSWKRTYTESTTQHFQLTDDALRLAADKPQEFRKLYGDYFIHSRIRGSMFTAVMTWQCTSMTEEKDVRGEASAKLELFGKKPLSTELYADLDKLISERKLKVHCTYKVFGEPTGSAASRAPRFDITKPGDVLGYLEWFKANSVGCDIALVLWRYTLLPELSVSLIRNANGFSEVVAQDLRAIRECLFHCRVLSNSIPDHLVGANSPSSVGELRASVVTLASRCSNKQPSLPSDASLRNDLLKQLRALRLRLRELHSAHDIWVEVDKVYREETGHACLPRIRAAKPQQRWGREVAVTREFFVLQEMSKKLRVNVVSSPDDGKHDVFLEILVEDLADFVVGWRVESSQALGSWRRVSPSIVFSRHAIISIRPGKRALFSSDDLYSEWTFTLYVLSKVPTFKMLCDFTPPAPTSNTIVTEDTRNSSKA